MNGHREEHPSYGMIGFSHVHGGNPYLFGSNIKHEEKIECTIRTGYAERDLNKDWFFGGNALITVEMSYSQFAEAISSMNIGTGVPCTITYTKEKGTLPQCTFESRRETYKKEFRDAINESAESTTLLIEWLREAFKKKTLTKTDKEKILSTLADIQNNITANSTYVFNQFDEHMDKTVTEAKAEVEAFTQAKLNSIALAALAQKERHWDEIQTSPVTQLEDEEKNHA